MSLPTGITQGTWNLDPAHSDISFSVRHAGISKVRGSFKDINAQLNVGETLEDSSVTAELKTASIDTRDENRDGHLKSGDFFDSENFPAITFKSTEISGSGGSYDMTGELTIRDTTSTVQVEVEFNGVAIDPFGNTRAGFSGETTINRKDFGLTWNAALETGGFLVGDKITISIDASFIAPKAD
ncbi:YceI family protein [Haematomicrobium sanguinis]|uniref:YceI family protein n=1 Tax=Haematomicrobium sanguinis TaxID=479106 RepID=UPI00047CF092|nr:YceI family protein [Haematomicrobium sanguinis]